MKLKIQCICGKACKNIRGLRIHQARMRYLTRQVLTQNAEVTSGETQEELGLETNRSAQSLQVSPKPTASKLPAIP